MKQNKWLAPMGILVMVTLAVTITGQAQSTVLRDSPVLPEPLPGSYAAKQRTACAGQTGAITRMGYLDTPMGFGNVFTGPGLYYSARFPMCPVVPQAVIYQSQLFPQPYGPYMPEIPASLCGW